MIPFDKEKWKAGWMPVTRAGEHVEHLTEIGTKFLSGIVLDPGKPFVNAWDIEGNSQFEFVNSLYNLMLKPPVVEKAYWYSETDDSFYLFDEKYSPDSSPKLNTTFQDGKPIKAEIIQP